MNHLNKQLEVDHSTLEQYLDEQDRKERVQQRLDRFGLGLMILCGLIGLAYCIANANTIFKKSSKDGIGALTEVKAQYAIAGIVPTQPGQSNASPASKENSKQSFVSIQGVRKAGEKLYFTLDAYDANATYEFHFGNGDIQKVSSDQMSYAYNMPGNYEVVLKVTYQGETEIAYANILNIKD